MLPDQKIAMEKLHKLGRIAAMAGNGVNDAPALVWPTGGNCARPPAHHGKAGDFERVRSCADPQHWVEQCR